MDRNRRMFMSVQYVKGVGPKRAAKLKRLGIETIEDLLYYIPREYDDRSNFKRISQCIDGDKASLRVEVCGYPSKLRPRRNLSILKIPVKDSSGFANLVWFNQDYISNHFSLGDRIAVNGKISIRGNEIQIMNPVFEKEKGNRVGRIVPIYSLTNKLSNNEMVNIMRNAIRDYVEKLPEVLPKCLRDELKLLPIHRAIKGIHFPKNREEYLAARRRLAFEELLVLQLGLLLIKNRRADTRSGIKFPAIDGMNTFIDNLPFELTKAQKRVFKEIEADMKSKKQMNRLIQGDVGSGKTIVAILAMFKAWKSGYQSVMMVPTEILATQHYESISRFFSDYNISCALLTGSIPNREKEKILSDLKSGKIDVLVGTHAVIQENVEFARLGLAITDEQHRFGVEQRAVLTQKGINPDILVMTATPIPRTLALILYGDLDISIIDELPPGRKPVETYVVGLGMIDRVNSFVKKQLLLGRQAYIVCPLIEESDKLKARSAEELYVSLKDGVYREFKVGLLHGNMKAKEKESIMDSFKAGNLDVLISTTVIEVGVNVPNANIMIIYNAERFGLAQLHQLRGRIGRGQYQSYCVLINEGKTRISRERMRVLQKSNDGFYISEKDLELRGPGEFFGTRQHGIPDLKVANLFTDMDMLKIAQLKSKEILKEDYLLLSDEYLPLRQTIINMFKDRVNDLIFN
ncbi:MAG TPA: ATP-dependent DNA helicase RecG [Tepidimicrobium sp.]|nr:ATP-dependent DNA helicase RecG [Tepidimicrobium sp.]